MLFKAVNPIILLTLFSPLLAWATTAKLNQSTSISNQSYLNSREQGPFHNFIDLSLAAKQFNSEESNKSLLNSQLSLNLVYNPNEDVKSKDLLNFSENSNKGILSEANLRNKDSIYGFYFIMSPSLNFNSGYQQDVYDNKQDNQIGLINANFNIFYSDKNNFSLASIGVSSHKKHSPLLFATERAFYGVQAEQQYKWNSNSIGIFTEYEIPTAQNLSPKTSEQEATPLFTSTGLFLKNRVYNFQSKLSLAYFEFKNLPLKLMSESTLLGNSSLAINQTEHTFLYEYKGLEARAKLDFNLVRNFNTNISYNYLINNSAPQELNTGSSFSSSQDIYKSKRISLALNYDYFKIDSDAAVSVYNDNNLQTNRIGYLAGMEVSFKQLLSISIRSGERDVQIENGFQIRERNIVLKLETSNVEI